MRVGLLKKRTGRRERSRAERRKGRRRRETLVTRARVEFGGSTRIVGRLENRAGQPAAGAAVQVFSSSSTVPEQQVGTVQTNSEGRFSYAARATASRIYRFVYGGTPLMLPAQRLVTVLVKAGSTIGARPREPPQRPSGSVGTVAISAGAGRGQAGGASGSSLRSVADIPHHPHRRPRHLAGALPLPAHMRTHALPVSSPAPRRSGLPVREWSNSRRTNPRSRWAMPVSCEPAG